MADPPQETPAGLLWKCGPCGTTSLWTPEHQWYGSIRQMDEGAWRRLVVTCSDDCRLAAAASGLVPDDAELLAS